MFNGLPRAKRKFRIGLAIAKFGDDFEYKDYLNGCEVWKIPVMESEFIIEEYVDVIKGIASGNIIILVKDCESGLKAAESAIKAIRKYCKHVTTLFPGGICRASSKVDSIRYTKLKALTNYLYCPTLKNKIPDTKFTNDVNCVYEIVINGLTIDAVKKAMNIAAIEAAKHEGVIKITAGNYGSKLGPYKTYLHDAVKNIIEEM